MAIKVAAYRCEYGCRRRAVQSKARMQAHEQVCIANPARRTCKTCAHNQREDHGFTCALDLVPDGQRIVQMCPGWAPVEGREG